MVVINDVMAVCARELCAFPQALQRERYEGPALFVVGADSDYVRPESHVDIERLFPHAQLEHIAGAGHWVHAWHQPRGHQGARSGAGAAALA